jgi:hypothetical protein
MASTAAAGAEDCHDWEKMQSSAAQRPGSAAAVLTRERSRPHAQAVGWNPVLGHGNHRCLPVQKTAMTGRKCSHPPPNGQVQLRPRRRDVRDPRTRAAGPSAGTSVRPWPRTPPAPRENCPPRRALAALPPLPAAQRPATPTATAQTSPADPIARPCNVGATAPPRRPPR